jgi:hypothetical protein
MFRRLALAALALAFFSAAPALAQSGGADREFSRLNADRAHRLGVQQYRSQNYDQALRQFEKAVALAPDVDNYRRSLAITRQRIAIEQANRQTQRENVERRRRLSGDDPASAPEPDRAVPGATERVGTDNPDMQRAPRMPSEPDGPEAAVRPPDLGGDAMQRENPMRGGLPADLPIAGTIEGTLPIGRLPDELFRAPARRPLPAQDTTEASEDGTPAADAILQPHLFPSLYPAPPPQPGQPPRLDSPDTLP